MLLGCCSVVLSLSRLGLLTLIIRFSPSLSLSFVSYSRNATAISKTLNKNFYRRDLIAAAQARASQINKAHLGKAQKKEVAAK